MTEPLSLRDLVANSLYKTARVIVPSLPFGAAFAGASGILVWSAGALPEGGTGFVLFTALSLAALLAHSLFSASMYRAVLPSDGGLITSAWKLTLAWLLIIVVAAIVATIVVLFFSLVGASLGVASGGAGQEIEDMTAEMRASGTFWPLFTLFIATLCGLFWFAVRLMLFASASALRGQVHVFRTWSWTKGHFIALAPMMAIFVIVPIVGLSVLAQSVSVAVFDQVETPLKSGLSAALTMLIMLPSAWLGHAFAAAAYERMAPKGSVDDRA